jgi:hypothetical protein
MSDEIQWMVEQVTTNQSSDEKQPNNHKAQVATNNLNELNIAVIHSIDKAVSLLSENIGDESRYLLFEWQQAKSCLTVVVTDDTKSIDSPQKVVLEMTNWTSIADDVVGSAGSAGFAESDRLTESAHANQLAEVFTQTLREWIHNYLTTSAGFMKYSLIAIFHADSRKKTVLL